MASINLSVNHLSVIEQALANIHRPMTVEPDAMETFVATLRAVRELLVLARGEEAEAAAKAAPDDGAPCPEPLCLVPSGTGSPSEGEA